MTATASKTSTPATTESTGKRAAKAEYKVISPLDLNNERFAPGDKVTLTEKEAEPLLDHTVEPVTAAN